ncbi:DNA primase [Bacillus phage G]|uniref:Gp229 n=1 Tax=Bacillus phage G TaxID=2884420 RepID=G3M9X0_9CAUD|nr:DNA primase [Bacillus phage G]AEO93488.1 gp229 [Bacillus phage G]
MAGSYRYDYVKSHIDTQEYISRYVSLKKVGMIFRCNCPIHGEKTPSFTVYPAGYNDPKSGIQEHASFFCFGCKKGGDIFDFKKAIDNLDTKYEALKLLEEELGIDMNDDEVQTNYLKEQLARIKHVDKVLETPEINMICSSICRNYLNWVKEEYPQFLEDEIKAIDKFYIYFDISFDEKSAIECMKLIDDVQEKIEKRRKAIKEKLIVEE